MQIIYLSTALSDEIYYDVVKQSKSFKPTFSGVGFDRNVALGLSEYVPITGISLYPIPSWPKYNSFIEKSRDYDIENFHCHIPHMVDFPYVKELSYNAGVKRYINKECGRLNNETIVVVCGLYRSLLRSGNKLKKKYGLKIVSIVPDVPELMSTYRKDYSKFRERLNKLDSLCSQKFRKCIDGFVFLSEHMNPVINNEGKPYIVVDGLTNVSSFPAKINNTDEKFILYAGKVSRTFGVDRLVEAFVRATIEEEIKLFICGDGDYSNELIKYAEKNQRIRYLGLVPHEKILELECQAELLIEPRPTNNEIVKMSFPSKIIEYMASGTPVLSTNLPCYSDEYALYQYRINDESVYGLQKAIENTLAIDVEERQKIGEKAKQYIYSNKTMQKQCERISGFIEKLL